MCSRLTMYDLEVLKIGDVLKIRNPKTGRFVSSAGKIGKSLMLEVGKNTIPTQLPTIPEIPNEILRIISNIVPSSVGKVSKFFRDEVNNMLSKGRQNGEFLKQYILFSNKYFIKRKLTLIGNDGSKISFVVNNTLDRGAENMYRKRGVDIQMDNAKLSFDINEPIPRNFGLRSKIPINIARDINTMLMNLKSIRSKTYLYTYKCSAFYDNGVGSLSHLLPDYPIHDDLVDKWNEIL